MLFASDKEVSKWTIFLGASLALIAASGIGVLVGSTLSNYVSEKYRHYFAGAVLCHHRALDAMESLRKGHPTHATLTVTALKYSVGKQATNLI